MSRQINLESELTPDEVEYLTSRGRDLDLARNAAFLLNRATVNDTNTATDDATSTADDATGDDTGSESAANSEAVKEDDSTSVYDTLSNDELRKEIDRRNEGRVNGEEPQIKPAGSRKREYIDALIADDARFIGQ